MIDLIVCAFARNLTAIGRTTSLLIVSMVSLAALARQSLADQPNKDARQKVTEGLQQYASGDFEKAAKTFAQAAEAAPNNPIIQFDEACAVSAAGDDDKARELLLQASVSSDPQVSAAACYNLAAIAAKKGRKELGDDPLAVAPEVRQTAIDRLKTSAAHYRDCLKVAPEHSDARHNLELVITLIDYLQKQWQLRDHQQALDKMSLIELLRKLDDQQLTIRSLTMSHRGQSMANVSRFDRSKLSTQQLKLQDDIPTLRSKIDSQLAEGRSGEASQKSDVEEQLRGLVTKQLEQADRAMRQSAEEIRSANWDRALEWQRSSVDCLRQMQMLFSTLPENVDLAIELQQALIDANVSTTGATSQNATGTSPTNAQKQASVAKDRTAEGQAWQQDWVGSYSRAVGSKASSMLQSMPEVTPESKPDTAPRTLPDTLPETTLEAETKQSGSIEESELTPEQMQAKQQEEFTKQLRKALERAVELTPTIMERSSEASRMLADSKSDEARPVQEEILRMLNEVRDLLPKQPNQDQNNQDQENQQQDRSQNNNQDKQQDKDQKKDQDKNQDQKDSNQQKPDQQQDSKNEDQQQNQGDNKDKKQDKDQNSEKRQSNDNKESQDPKESSDSDKSQKDKKADSENSQPKDEKSKKDDSAKKEDSAKQNQGDDAKKKTAEEKASEQAGKELGKSGSADKSAEQTAQQIAEQRAQAVLRRIREREARYRELLQQLRERQSNQMPVEKDW